MKKANRIYLGISGVNSHDSAASLIIDGKVVAAAEEERFIREKHTGKFPYNAVNFCLSYANIKPKNVDCVAYYVNPNLRYRNTLLFNLRTAYSRIEHILRKEGLKKVIESIKKAVNVELSFATGYNQALSYVNKHFKNAKFKTIDHHDCHAASAFYLSPFEDASVLTVDLIGEWDTTRFYEGHNSKLKRIKSIAFPNSIGKFYQTFTKFLGFTPNSDEYKVMGLAAFGTDNFVSFFNSLYKLNVNGTFSLNDDLLLFCKGIRPEWDERIFSVIGTPREANDLITQNHEDIAYALQQATEEILLHLASNLVKATGNRCLCMAGGVALNVLANQKIRESGLIDELFIQPVSNDAGTSLGSALFTYFTDNPKMKRYPMETCYLGPEYSSEYIEEIALKSGYSFKKGSQILDDIVELLITEKVVAIFHGRMEFGQRALGNRSILANPRNPNMKEIMNSKVKFRELFRPFAPVILEEEVENYFINGRSSPFMTQTFSAKELCINNSPAIVHQDGTSRIQTITQTSNPKIYSIIKKFKDKTNVPILMNTSFNVAGEPIVCTPENAFQTFNNSGIDAMLMEDLLIVK